MYQAWIFWNSKQLRAALVEFISIPLHANYMVLLFFSQNPDMPDLNVQCVEMWPYAKLV